MDFGRKPHAGNKHSLIKTRAAYGNTPPCTWTRTHLCVKALKSASMAFHNKAPNNKEDEAWTRVNSTIDSLNSVTRCLSLQRHSSLQKSKLHARAQMCIHSNVKQRTSRSPASKQQGQHARVDTMQSNVHDMQVSRGSVTGRRERNMHVHSAAHCKSNIPAIIQHAEQARRHNAIRPRSKGAREQGRMRKEG